MSSLNKNVKNSPQVRGLARNGTICIVVRDGAVGIAAAAVVGSSVSATSTAAAAMSYLIKGLASVTRPCILEPDLNDPRREIELTAQTVDLIAFRSRLHSKISLQHLQI